MDTVFEQKVRLRAYEIWLASGMNEGDAEHHWLRAEVSVRNETEVPTGAGKAAAKAKPAKTATVKAASTKPRATVTKTAKAAKTEAATPAPRRARPAAKDNSASI